MAQICLPGLKMDSVSTSNGPSSQEARRQSILGIFLAGKQSIHFSLDRIFHDQKGSSLSKLSYANNRTCGIFINAQTGVQRRMNFRVSASFLSEAPWLSRFSTSHPWTHCSHVFLAFIVSLRLSESYMWARSWAACPHGCLSFEPTSQYEKNFIGASAVSSWSSLHLGQLSKRNLLTPKT